MLTLNKILYKTVITALVAITVFSCANDIEKINAITSEVNYPDLSGDNIHIKYTDSSRLKIILKSARIEQYSNIKEPYTYFPEGIKVQFYNKQEDLESTIQAKKATYYQNEALWKAEDSVIAVNLLTNEKLITDLLYWDETSELIYSDVYTKVLTPSGNHFGENGFEANQNLDWWQLKKVTKGNFVVKDNEQ